MDALLLFLKHAGVGLGFVVVWLLCVGGLLLSCLSLSGTWLILLATVLAAALSTNPFPGLWTIMIFIALASAVELLEWYSGMWGVSRRGGSRLAGFMALVGGLLGLLAGGMIPIPIVGSLLGMIVFSFALVFLVERNRLQHDGQAAHIAMGAVVARVLVIILKVGVTLCMIAWLVMGMLQK